MIKKKIVLLSILSVLLGSSLTLNRVTADTTADNNQNVVSVNSQNDNDSVGKNETSDSNNSSTSNALTTDNSNTNVTNNSEVQDAATTGTYSDVTLHDVAIVKVQEAQVYSCINNGNGSSMTEVDGKMMPYNTGWVTDIKRTMSDGVSYYRINTNEYIRANDSGLESLKPKPTYQNPAGWLQIQNTQIQPHGNVGYYLYSGVEGIKVWLLKQKLGVPTSNYQSNIYNAATIQRVKQVQSAHGLTANGITDYKTWCAAGMNPADWEWLDSYIHPLLTNANSSRSDHVEAMIKAAYEYMGKPWVSGSASSPVYGVDCSGLVTQAMYAAGVDPAPVGSIQHAQPGNEWNCQLLYKDSRIHNVPFGQGKRGDLIFYADPANGSIWHVAIYLGNSQIIDSWPGHVAVGALNPGNKGNIVKIGRIFY